LFPFQTLASKQQKRIRGMGKGALQSNDYNAAVRAVIQNSLKEK
jgi:hypothetical protein